MATTARRFVPFGPSAAVFARACSISAALIVAGCNDPQSIGRQQRRYHRITETLDDCQERDERRPRQIEWLADTSKRQQTQRDENLKTTLRRISDRYDRDVRYLHQGDPVQKARLERNWNGHPENIPDVWSRLVF